ncbi:MAG: hypothetical protein ACI9SG_002174, partial [Maribacter sp.]
EQTTRRIAVQVFHRIRLLFKPKIPRVQLKTGNFRFK